MEEHIMGKVGESLLRGAQEALAYAKGKKKSSKTRRVKIPDKVDVGAIRNKLNMSQDTFAASFGFKKRTIEKWEQGTRHPAGAVRAYLTAINHNPNAVRSALSGGTVRLHAGHKEAPHKVKA
jgi:putative transcriptional regulator